MAGNLERPVRWGFLGRVGYREGLRRQEQAREALRRGAGDDQLILLEHPHVYTLGRNADAGDVTAGRRWLEQRGVEVVECDRGGQVTYHGPGQLVGYPVIELAGDRRDIRRYVADLQQVLIRTLGELGIAAEGGCEQSRIGIWVGEHKIASIGVHISRWITTHGFALNAFTDLSYFQGIVPCGLQDVRMTSIGELTGKAPSLEALAGRCAHHFGRVFGREMWPPTAA